MDLQQHKEEVIRLIVEVALDRLEKGQLTQAQMPEIANFVLTNVDRATDHHQIVKVALDLASRYPIFKNVAEIESGEERKFIESSTAQTMAQMIKEGKVQDALNLSKTVIQR